MFNSAKIALAAALVLGAASAVRANDSGENHQDEGRTAVSGGVAGKSANAGGAYGLAAAPIHKLRPARGQSESR
jgi:hypothetical protein